MDWPSWIMSALGQPFVSSIIDRFTSVMRVLYIFSRNNPTRRNQLDSNEFRGHNWGGINFRVTFSDNAVVVRVR